VKPFLPALRLSLRYRWSIIGALICSAGVALLWCASLTTIYPVLQVVLENKTAVSWSNGEMARCAERIAGLEARIASGSGPADQAGDAAGQRYQAGLARKQLKAEQRALAWHAWLHPFLVRHAPLTPFSTLAWAIGFLLVISLLKGVLLVISAVLVARVANRTVMDMRRIYYRKALELDQRRIENIGTANLMTHLSHNMLMVSGGVQMFYGKMLREPLKMLACLVGAAWLCWPLLIVSLAVVPAGAWVVHSLSLRMKRSTQREMDGMGTVFQTLIETFGSIRTVRIFNQEIRERRRFKANAASLYRIGQRISFYDSLIRPATEILGIISIAGSILAGAWLVLHQQTSLWGITLCPRPLDPMSLLLFYSFLAGASDPARKMTEVVNILVRGGAACENLERTFAVEPRVRRPEQPEPVPQHRKAVTFERVSFAYRPRQTVLNSVSLEVPFGQTVAIVGENGCGKSTLMNLLVRFYDPFAGRILLDGSDLRSFSPRQLRRQFAWVTQESELFSATLRENIAYGNRHAGEEEVLAAARLARVTDFLDVLPDGFQTKVGDGGKLLSAGQRQRVALARAILANPAVLILDEATSQIDGRNEALLHDSLRQFFRGRTTFIISHRRSSLELADRIVVMAEGRIVSDQLTRDGENECREFQGLFSRSA
jgi:ATP-binding cassette, subfamily B, bacterial MsbA